MANFTPHLVGSDPQSGTKPHKRVRRRFTGAGTGSLPPANNLAGAKRRDALIKRIKTGAEIVEALYAGTSMAELGRQTGHSHRTLHKMVANFSQYAPEEYRQMVEGTRGFLARLVFDDLVHWRNLTRNPPLKTIKTKEGTVMKVRDLEAQKLAVTAYHSSMDTLIKIFGLATHRVELDQASTREPMTFEELRQKCAHCPEVAAVVAEFARVLEPAPTVES